MLQGPLSLRFGGVNLSGVNPDAGTKADPLRIRSFVLLMHSPGLEMQACSVTLRKLPGIKNV